MRCTVAAMSFTSAASLPNSSLDRTRMRWSKCPAPIRAAASRSVATGSLIQRRTNLDATEAYMLCSLAADVRVTQLVNEQKGCHVVLPKSALG